MTYIKINETLYPAEISGKLRDSSWDDRSSKTIRLEMTYEEAIELFVDDLVWSIVEVFEYENAASEEAEYDNSEYCVAGDITDHRDGTVSVKMGKVTDAELIAIMTGTMA